MATTLTYPSRLTATSKRIPAQRLENAHVRTSSVFQRQVLDAAMKYFSFRADGEISALVVDELSRRWPEVTERDVDWVLVGCAAAARSEAASYRESMQAGLTMGTRAAAEVWRESAEVVTDGFGRPMGRAGRKVTEEGAA